MEILNEECLIISHLSLNDLFIINGIINYYTIKYNKIYLVCKKIYINTINQFFSHNPIIIPIYIDIENDIINDNPNIFQEYKNCDIIKIGMNNENWIINKYDLIIGKHPYLYFKTFYKQLNLNYELKYNYEKINRNVFKEKKFYNDLMFKYNDDYKFVMGIKNNDIIDNKIQMNLLENLCLNKKLSHETECNKIPIFTPYYNFYNKKSIFYDFWKNKISDNIFDYCLILEKAKEIHIEFNEFLSLCMFLNISNIKKYVYTNITNIKDYHKNMEDWNIVYIN